MPACHSTIPLNVSTSDRQGLRRHRARDRSLTACARRRSTLGGACSNCSASMSSTILANICTNRSVLESFANRSSPSAWRGALDRRVVQPEVEDRVHHPGHRERRARAHRHQQRIDVVAEPLAHLRFEGLERRADLVESRPSGNACRPRAMYVHASVVIVNPGGTGRPRLVISARLAPLPPSRNFCSLEPSSKA